jgi:hypothetical protein
VLGVHVEHSRSIQSGAASAVQPTGRLQTTGTLLSAKRTRSLKQLRSSSRPQHPASNGEQRTGYHFGGLPNPISSQQDQGY